MYRIFNGNLLYHGCVPLDESGNLEGVAFGKKRYHGREYLDYAERIARRAWSKDVRQKDRDFMWYLWCGRKSPLSGRNIKTFERTYVLDENSDLYLKLNKELVSSNAVTDKYDVMQLKDMIREHVEATDSERGKEILANFSEYLPKFKKIIPHDYQAMLQAIAQMEEKGLSNEQAQIEAFYQLKKAR